MYELYNILYNIVTVWFADVRLCCPTRRRRRGIFNSPELMLNIELLCRAGSPTWTVTGRGPGDPGYSRRARRRRRPHMAKFPQIGTEVFYKSEFPGSGPDREPIKRKHEVHPENSVSLSNKRAIFKSDQAPSGKSTSVNQSKRKNPSSIHPR